ncbi:hypothetical protein PVAP13_2NG241706 [Panicum virgatum]|uniref:Uncharacterized protein n=1 Tax=Panicum virgatum TaxID=38727 RepID=A0A8T0VBA5_PANVG|nr:hypothetical protein PVAP13_2NG241706 [Panicum virgatum]
MTKTPLGGLDQFLSSSSWILCVAAASPPAMDPSAPARAAAHARFPRAPLPTLPPVLPSRTATASRACPPNPMHAQLRAHWPRARCPPLSKPSAACSQTLPLFKSSAALFFSHASVSCPHLIGFCDHKSSSAILLTLQARQGRQKQGCSRRPHYSICFGLRCCSRYPCSWIHFSCH